MRDTLGGLVAERDAAVFVGRRVELDVLEAMCRPDSTTSVALVWGPGGIGKSALLRELARRVAPTRQVHRIDGAELSPSADELDAVVGSMDLGAAPLLLIDSYERIGSLGTHLRRNVLPALPVNARVVLAGRVASERAWRADGWDAVTVHLRLGPMTDTEAGLLVHRRGVADACTAEVIVGWAKGLPLALAVGAETASGRTGSSEVLDLGAGPLADDLDGHGFAASSSLSGDLPIGDLPFGDPETNLLDAGHHHTAHLDVDDLDAALTRVLLAHLDGDDGSVDRDVLAVGAVAPRCDAQLLAAVLPGVQSDRAEAMLRGLSFVHGLGSRFAMHDRIRAALRDELRRRDPAFERELRRRIVDQFHDRAFLGEPWLLFEIIQLIENPVLRWGVAEAADAGLSFDRLRPGDLEVLAARVAADAPPWWPGVERWLVEAPDHALVIRQGARLAGVGILATLSWRPPWSDEDVVMGPWIEHARRTDADPGAFLLREAFDLVGDPGDAHSPVLAAGNLASVVRSGVANPRRFYCHADSANTGLRSFMEAVGYQRLPEADANDGRDVRAFVVDHGPGGAIAAWRDLVYREMGAVPPPRRDRAEVSAQAVRDALRAFHDPVALSRSPLARGTTTEQRAEAVRVRIGSTLDVAFGDSEDERLQRAVLERGYLDPDGSHTRAARALHLSRSTYYRRLAAATDRLAERIAPDVAPSS